MRIIHTYKKCKRCLTDLSIEEFHYSEKKDQYNTICKNCISAKNNKTGRINRNRIVKASWLNCVITLGSGEKIHTNKITELDIQKIIDNDFGFILIGYDPKGKIGRAHV